MKMRKYVVAAAIAAAATTAVGGTTYAAPVDAPDGSTLSTDLAPGINYTASIVDNSVVISTDAGSLTTVGNQFQILDDHGNMVAGIPLTYRKNNADYPIAAKVRERTVTLTPSTDASQAVPAQDVAQDIAVPQVDAAGLIASAYATPEERETAALGRFVQQVTVASMVGAMIGTIVGGVIGCVGGLVVGGAATAPVAWLLGAGPLAGCIGGAALLAPIGALAGTIALGGPILTVALFQYFETMNTPLDPPAPAPAPGA
ncbi:hypothetical protein ABZ413_02240 [Nocardia rhamnosiphila]|uniref:hypothetical protein n=1 Tax=Nocardia rhamnosiphila TaxID=426716 RepID=UPI0033F0B4C0